MCIKMVKSLEKETDVVDLSVQDEIKLLTEERDTDQTLNFSLDMTDPEVEVLGKFHTGNGKGR